MIEQIKSRIGQFSQLLGLRLYAAGVGFLVTMILGRMLGPSEFGAYVFAMGWLAVLLLFATFGFQLFTTRTLPPLIVKDQRAEAMGVIVFSTVSVALLSVVATAIVFVNTTSFSDDPLLQGAVAIGALMLLPQAWNMLRTGILQGLGHPVAAQIPERLVAPTLLLLALVVCWLMGWALTARDVLLLTLATLVIALIQGVFTLQGPLGEIGAKPVFRDAGTWIIGAAKSSAVFASLTVLTATDVIMLGMLSTPEETGVYGVAARFFLLMGLPLHAGGVQIAHRAAKLRAENDNSGLAHAAVGVANRGFIASLALALPCTIAAFFTEEIFGTGFGLATIPILILVWTRVVISLFGQAGAILANIEFVGSVAVISTATVLLNLVLNGLLIPMFGANGAATATALSNIVMTLGYIILLKKRLNIFSFIGRAT